MKIQRSTSFAGIDRIPGKQRLYRFAGCLMAVSCILLAACSENENYGLRPVAYVNFYNAAEVLQQNVALQADNRVYINDSLPNDTFRNFPEFSLSSNSTAQRQFPEIVSDADSHYYAGQVNLSTDYQYVYYMAIAPGSYRFIYTGPNKVYWRDSTFVLAKDGYTELYLTEDLAADGYRIVALPGGHGSISGKVRVRVVHLSADTEPLGIARVYADGSTADAGFPQQTSFGEATDYVALDTAGASKQYKKIVLQFSPAGSPGKALTTVSIPAEAGASFTVLVRGFKNQEALQIITGYDAGGNPIYKSYTVDPNLRTDLRRNY